MESQPSKSGRSTSRSNSDANVAATTPTSATAATSQSLSSILNNPNASESTSWINWWPASASLTGAAAASSPAEFLPISSTKAATEVTRSDLQPYVASISEPYHRFEDVLKHASEEAETSSVAVDGIGGQGEALAACLREVPSLFFKEDFALEDGATFRSACPFSNVSENVALQEKLTHYLDVVELHLVKEISLRSDSFFEAQLRLQGLDSLIVEGVGRVRALRETIKLLDADLVGPAEEIRRTNRKRSDLVAIQQKLALILNVNQALVALKLLVAAADCAGALDITDDLQHLLEGDELTGLHCFRHLRDHVGMSIESINSILSAEFLRNSVHDARDTDIGILSKAKARGSITANGKNDNVKLDKEEASSFRDRLLPIIIGLLRTAKLPAVLRLYRDNLTTHMKTAIKNAVADMLPVLIPRPLESEVTPGDRAADGDGASASLASKLRSLSSESFVQLLSVIFMIVRVHLERAAEVKKAIEWIMSSLDGHYAADSVAAAIAVGAAAAEIANVQDDLVPLSQKSIPKVPLFQGKGNDAANSSNMSKNFRTDVLRENTEAVFAACDASHGRWAKLLGVRALLHPKLRLQEFLSIYNITQDFITATEKIGGRIGYSIRGTLQSQAKAFVDFQHESRMTKIRAVLDQETWVEVEVPDEFQAIVTSLFFSEALTSENQDDAQDISVEEKSARVTEAIQKKKDDVNSVAQISQNNSKDRGKSSSQTLLYNDIGYHMVNCGLILLKMLSEYVDMNNSLPTLSSEIVHRVVEILKFFNTRTCQLVLGAGAMQVSGLKSITSKHLALASQVISFIYAIIPEIRRILLLKVPDARKSLLLLEIDRVAQDYKVHRDEIHSKLVQIMRERLLVHLRSLPQIVEGWNRPEDTDPQPSQFARSLTKEVGFLQRVLSRTLHDVDVRAIFRQVVVIFHTQISETFSQMEINTPQATDRLHRDITHILACIRSLPTDSVNESGTPNWGQLDEFLAQRFGGETG